MERSTFSLEAVALRSANYYERLVDAQGLPYFNVFWTDPAVAAHDWPDFGDVMSRQLQGAIMLRRMTGRKVATEDAWRRNILSFIDPGDGLFHRPATPWSTDVPDWGDNALTLYALVTAHDDSGDPETGRAARRMAEGLHARAHAGDRPRDFPGFIVKSLMACARRLGSEPALELARTIVGEVFGDESTFTRDNTFQPRGHMHGNLRTLVGAIDLAALAGDTALRDRVDALYRWVRSIGTRFGFLPESWARPGDIVSCETCALMDYAGLGSSLANLGTGPYWDDMERLARNHYVESQLLDASWLHSEDSRPDTARCTWREIGSRSLGAWAGWSSPTRFLAARETLNAHWGGPELRDRTRALQNCCGGSGVHGLFILWKNASRVVDGTLWVHMHLDRLLPQAEIRCLQPWKGLTSVTVRQACPVRVRIPEFARQDSIRVTRNGAQLRVPAHDGYLVVDGCSPGDIIEVSYPLPLASEEVSVGNPGWRQYRYRVTWKGDTVVRMEPLGNDAPTGWSDYDKAQVPVFFGSEGPGELYRREHMVESADPALSVLHEDDGSLDYWKL